MLLKKVQYFLQIVEAGTLSKAAERLYLTQPTLSRFLSRLEEEAGIQLFLRQKAGTLKLTEAGQVYLQAAQKIEEVWVSMESELHALKEKAGLSIRLSIDGDPLFPFAQSCADIVSGFYPNISVEIRSIPTQIAQEMILSGTLDFALGSYTGLNKLLTYEIFDRSEIDLVVSNASPLAKYSYQLPGQEDVKISLRDLPPDTPFLLAREGLVLRHLVDSYMQQQQFTPYVPNTFNSPAFISDILGSKKSLVCFCPRNHNYSTVSHIALDPPLYNNRGICYSKYKKLSPAESLLVDLLRDAPKKRYWEDILARHNSSD